MTPTSTPEQQKQQIELSGTNDAKRLSMITIDQYYRSILTPQPRIVPLGGRRGGRLDRVPVLGPSLPQLRGQLWTLAHLDLPGIHLRHTLCRMHEFHRQVQMLVDGTRTPESLGGG